MTFSSLMKRETEGESQKRLQRLQRDGGVEHGHLLCAAGSIDMR